MPIPSYRLSLDEVARRRPLLCLTLDGDLEAAEEGRVLGDERTVPPEEGLEYYARLIVGRILNKEDAIVAVTGPRGRGKSTLVLRLIERISDLLGMAFDLDQSLIYTHPQLGRYFLRLTESDERGLVGWLDEGGRILFNRDAGTVESKAIVKILTQIREAGGIMFVCLPNLRSLDVAVRTDLAAIWLAVRRRGLARCHLRDNRLQYRPETNYGFAVNPAAPHLTWRAYRENSKRWGDYRLRKRENLRSAAHEAYAELLGKRAARAGEVEHEIVDGESRAERRARLNRERQRRFRQRHARRRDER